MARAYYNEIDPAAVAILRELIAQKAIAPGDVDDRSIKDVKPHELRGYTQCHFFAGGGLWSVGARLGGWPDDRQIWTGSCPCQGESLAGKRLGADDPRHLWPDFFRLIRTIRPPVVMGEQVAAAAGTHWLDGVCADLADEDYSARAVDIPACAVDAPHQRNRLYWTAVDNRIGARLEGQCGHVAGSSQGGGIQGGSVAATDAILFPDAAELRGRTRAGEDCPIKHRTFAPDDHDYLQPNTSRCGRNWWQEASERSSEQRAFAERPLGLLRNGSFWADGEWIVSPLDGKARRTKSGLPFLVDGLPGRVDLWRVGGNAISPILAAEVIAAFLDAEADSFAPLHEEGQRDA